MSNPQIQNIEELKESGKLDEALRVANTLLRKDPSNKDILIQIADIEYRKWEIARAEKPIDFLLHGLSDDAMSLYIKWVLQMEKTNRQDAKSYFKRALQILDEENPEILRCYGLCEYWLWHREQWIEYLKKAFESNKKDAEIILNIIEIAIMEESWWRAKKYIAYYYAHVSSLNFFDRERSHYDDKIALFDEFIKSNIDEQDENSTK